MNELKNIQTGNRVTCRHLVQFADTAIPFSRGKDGRSFKTKSDFCCISGAARVEEGDIVSSYWCWNWWTDHVNRRVLFRWNSHSGDHIFPFERQGRTFNERVHKCSQNLEATSKFLAPEGWQTTTTTLRTNSRYVPTYKIHSSWRYGTRDLWTPEFNGTASCRSSVKDKICPREKCKCRSSEEFELRSGSLHLGFQRLGFSGYHIARRSSCACQHGGRERYNYGLEKGICEYVLPGWCDRQVLNCCVWN